MKISQLTDHTLSRRVTHEGYSRRSVTLIKRCVVALLRCREVLRSGSASFAIDDLRSEVNPQCTVFTWQASCNSFRGYIRVFTDGANQCIAQKVQHSPRRCSGSPGAGRARILCSSITTRSTRVGTM